MFALLKKYDNVFCDLLGAFYIIVILIVILCEENAKKLTFIKSETMVKLNFKIFFPYTLLFFCNIIFLLNLLKDKDLYSKTNLYSTTFVVLGEVAYNIFKLIKILFL